MGPIYFFRMEEPIIA